VDRCDAYRHFAERCGDLARTMDSPQDRSILLKMASVWSRLAEYATKEDRKALRSQSGETIPRFSGPRQ
jgi:hypothetical protein